MHSPEIHIICKKAEIAELIEKTLRKSGYGVSSTSGDNLSVESVGNIGAEVDCLVLDKNIEVEIKNAAVEKFKDAKVICLPSLEPESSISGEAEYMSEPLKLSELTQFINNMFPA